MMKELPMITQLSGKVNEGLQTFVFHYFITYISAPFLPPLWSIIYNRDSCSHIGKHTEGQC